MSEDLNDMAKDALRALSPAARRGLCDWFDGDPHYRELLAFLRALEAQTQAQSRPDADT